VKNEQYFNFLKEKATGKKVRFLTNASDAELLDELCSSDLAVFASTFIDHENNKVKGEPELLGIAPLESMGLGLNTIVSNVGAYPEIAMRNCLFSDGNVIELKKIIKEKLDNPMDITTIKRKRV